MKALPALLEISKKGGRFDEKDLEVLRPSFRAAVMEAREVWEKKAEPSNFTEFVLIREQSGEGYCVVLCCVVCGKFLLNVSSFFVLCLHTSK